MTEDVIKALAKALDGALAERKKEYTIYTENVEQGLKQPCFFIYCNGYKDELYRGKRYKLSTNIVIEYIPPDTKDDRDTNRNVNNILPKLYDITETIEVDGNLLRGLDRSIENTDGGVVFNVRYEYFYYKNEDIDKMEILKQEGVLKNG